MKQFMLLLFLPGFSFSQTCKDIKPTPTKTAGVHIYESPDSNAVQFTKDIKGNNAVYRIHLRMMQRKIDLGQKGVTIVFEDGSKIVKPDETVDVNNLDDKFEFTATFILVPEELGMLQKKKIVKFFLFTHQRDLTPDESAKFKDYANCIPK